MKRQQNVGMINCRNEDNLQKNEQTGNKDQLRN